MQKKSLYCTEITEGVLNHAQLKKTKQNWVPSIVRGNPFNPVLSAMPETCKEKVIWGN